MIDPSPSANPGQVVSERPGSYSSPLTVMDARAPQTSGMPIESHEASPSCSPHEVLETPNNVNGDLHTLRSDPHAYIPPQAGSETSSSADLRSSPQVYPDHVNAYHHNGVPHQSEPSYVGMPYIYPQSYQQSYPQSYPQLYHQPYAQPYLSQPAMPQPQLQETSHLPLDYISLPTTAEPIQQTPASNHSLTHDHVPQVTSQPSRPNRPYPTPAPTTSAPVQHGSVDASPPSTPIKQPPRRSHRKRWICLFMLIVVAIAVAVGVVMSKKNSGDDKSSDHGGDQANIGKGDKGPQGPSSSTPPVATSTSFTTTLSASPSPTNSADPTQPPPTKPTASPEKPPPSGDFWTCFRSCFDVKAECEARCENEESYKSCVNGCSDTHCRLGCRLESSCLSSCFDDSTRCHKTCGSPP